MRTRSPIPFPLYFVLILMISSPAGAQWVENGKGVCTVLDAQDAPVVVPDGNGGSIVVWQDDRTLPTKVYAQRIDQYGVDQWAADGVQLYMNTSSPYYITAATDGAGGAVVAILTFSDSLYVQRVTGDGSTWSPLTGVGICGTVSVLMNPYMAICSDGAGGAIVFWTDDRSGSNIRIYGQRVDSSGVAQWTANGELVANAAIITFTPVCCPDASGGAIVAWDDQRSDPGDIYAQRLDASGSALWTANGIPVCDAAGHQQQPDIADDGAGGAVLAWKDGRTGGGVYVQKIDAAGTALWTVDGVAAISAVADQAEIGVVSDAAGGAIASWIDTRNTLVNADVYAQRVDSSGAAVWETNGTAICTAPSIQAYSRITEDGAGGAVLVWNDARDGMSDIYAQRINPAGDVLWAENGEPVCVGYAGARYEIDTAYIGDRGVVIAWSDNRAGEFEYDIYAQGLGVQGYWGYPEPLIHSVEDVPGDQGGVINLFWYASLWEDPPYDTITHYTIWRAVEPQEAMIAIQSGGRLIDDPVMFAAPDAVGRVFRRSEASGTTYFWEYIDTQTAYNFEAYAKAIPTLFDSTAVYHAYHYVQVLSHTAVPDEYYTSGVDSAYSVDNLAPAAPIALAGEQSQSPAGLRLTWDPNTESDLGGYNVYRGTSIEFLPASGNLVSSTTGTEVFDDEWTWDVDYWYKVAAVDVHGNESSFAVLAPDLVTGSDGEVTPKVTYLGQNYPNPFNPVTRIAFGLREAGHVSLEVYDAAGRLVATLVDEKRAAGPHIAEWMGVGADGRPLASGVYFYKLRAGGFEQTKKMVLVR